MKAKLKKLKRALAAKERPVEKLSREEQREQLEEGMRYEDFLVIAINTMEDDPQLNKVLKRGDLGEIMQVLEDLKAKNILPEPAPVKDLQGLSDEQLLGLANELEIEIDNI